MNLTHHLDLMRYVSGIDFEVVGGLTAATEPPTTVEDTVAIAVRYANGALGSVAGHSAARGTAETEISFWGRDGRLTIEPRARVYSLRPLPGLQHARWTSFGRLPAVDIRAVYFARLAHSIATSSPPDVTGADGLAVQAAIEGAYRAQGEGRSIPVAELLGVSAPDHALAR
jgi:predicted dehydrogenase